MVCCPNGISQIDRNREVAEHKRKINNLKEKHKQELANDKIVWTERMKKLAANVRHRGRQSEIPDPGFYANESIIPDFKTDPKLWFPILDFQNISKIQDFQKIKNQSKRNPRNPEKSIKSWKGKKIREILENPKKEYKNEIFIPNPRFSKRIQNFPNMHT